MPHDYSWISYRAFPLTFETTELDESVDSSVWRVLVAFAATAKMYARQHSETIQGGPKTDTHIYFGDNFGNSAPILTILSLLQADIYGA